MYSDGHYEYNIDYSTDGLQWKSCSRENNARGNNGESLEWPVQHHLEVKARYFRIQITNQTLEPNRVGLWEARFY